MLCLTVYEAKGLEFDDVILFNFLSDSKCGNQWMLIKDVIIGSRFVKLEEKNDNFLDFEKLEVTEV